MSEHVKLRQMQEETHHEDEHNHTNFDTHYWVSLNKYILIKLPLLAATPLLKPVAVFFHFVIHFV